MQRSEPNEDRLAMEQKLTCLQDQIKSLFVRMGNIMSLMAPPPAPLAHPVINKKNRSKQGPRQKAYTGSEQIWQNSERNTRVSHLHSALIRPFTMESLF